VGGVDERYVDGSYGDSNKDWHESDASWKGGHLVSLLSAELIEEFRRRVPLKVAEIGCGTCGVLAAVGSFLRERRIPCELTGYDIAPRPLELAAALHPEVRRRCSDFRQDRDPYDLGLMVDFFEHVERPEEFLGAAHDRFRWMLFHIPLDRNLWGRILRGRSYFSYLLEDRGHLHYYTQRSALALLRGARFRPIRWKYTHWGLERPAPAGRSAKPLRLARRIGRRLLPNLSVRIVGGASLAVLTDSE